VTEVRNVHTQLLRKPEGKRQLTQEDNTTTDLEEQCVIIWNGFM
jgi:hypothetical protein